MEKGPFEFRGIYEVDEEGWMKAVVQRVDNASVEIEGDVISRIDKGLVVLLGIGKGDTEEDAACLIEKIKNLRIFEDDAGRFDQSLLDVGGELLIVSQFTLYADCSKGRRPGFDLAASPDDARRLYNHFVDLSKMSGIKVATGRFQAHMLVRIANQGPVTIILDCPIRGV